MLAPLIEFAAGHKVRVGDGRRAESFWQVATWVAGKYGTTARNALRLFRTYENPQGGEGALRRKPHANRGLSKLFGRAPQTIPDDPEGLFDSLTEAGKYIVGLYLRDNFSPRACCDALAERHQAGELGLEKLEKPPSENAVRRFLSSLSKPFRDYARQTAQRWNDCHRPSVRRDYETCAVLQWWNLDHAQDDFFCYNDFLPELGRYVFPDSPPNHWLRMWLTAVQDVRSRYIVGYCFSAIPSSLSIVSAIRMAVNRCGRPPLYGLTDRGKDFLKTVAEGPQVTGALLRLIRAFHGEQGDAVKAIGRNPQSKPIESWFKLKRERFDQLVYSRAGNAPQHRPDSTQALLDAHEAWVKAGAQGFSPALPPASETACKTVQWIERWYHLKHRHTGDGMFRRTPEQVFRAGWPLEQQEAARAQLDPRLLEEFLWHREPRAVRDGCCVRLFGALYEPADAESLAALRAWDGDARKVQVACDPYQLDDQPGYAVAYHPETGERLGALTSQRRFAWGEPQENIKAHLRGRGKFRRAVKGAVEQLAQQTTAGQPFGFLEATGTDGLAAPIASSPRVLRAREQRRLSEPRVKTWACDVSDEAAALLDQVKVDE